MKKVVVLYCDENKDEVSKIFSHIVNSHDTILPLAPDIVFHFLDDDKPEDAEKKLILSYDLISDCDEIWVFGNYEKNEIYQRQIQMARLLGKVIRYWGQEGDG